MVATTPSTKATTSAGAMNCQADMPADARDHQFEPARQIEVTDIVPISTQNGMMRSVTCGTR